MRGFAKVLRATVVVMLVSAPLCEQAAACPHGYFQCGNVCCPNR
jgi:hypothetical protein